jgi:hypothetical protein
MMTYNSSFDDESYEAFHYEQQKAEFEEWIETDEGVLYINTKLLDAMYEDQLEVNCEV